MVGSTIVSSAPRSSVSWSSMSRVGHVGCRADATSSGGCPSRTVSVDAVDDLLVQIEAQVVAGREVGEPLVADADAAAFDLVDHRVGHRMERSSSTRSLHAASQRSIRGWRQSESEARRGDSCSRVADRRPAPELELPLTKIGDGSGSHGRSNRGCATRIIRSTRPAGNAGFSTVHARDRTPLMRPSPSRRTSRACRTFRRTRPSSTAGSWLGV